MSGSHETAPAGRKNFQKAVCRTIHHNRDDFVHYNIIRIRELIRYLPEERLELFNIIPFLLHVNMPGIPGYINNPLAAYGIYGFMDSGFLKTALDHYGLDEAGIHPYLARKNCINGLYLMGSTGTLAQGRQSDFDFWVIVDESLTNPIQIRLLREKLAVLEKWSDETYDHNLNFFVHRARDLKNNYYGGIDGESDDSAQKTILKEEFYRTFIMIAGRIPFWAVIPAGLPDDSYDAWVSAASSGAAGDDAGIKFIDIGNLAGIDENECLGAILWQVYKARHDPAKSLIKACLIAYFNFYNDSDDLPCNLIKKQFSNRVLDGIVVDPYSVIFNKTIVFFEAVNNMEIFETLRECVFLRICGYPLVSSPGEDTPKRRILERFVEQWGWSREKVDRFLTYSAWPEEKKMDYDIKLFRQISFLYELILKSREGNSSAFKMDHGTLMHLKNSIASHFTQREGKIERCSSSLKARVRTGTVSVTVSCSMGRRHKFTWSACGSPEQSGGSPPVWLESDSFLHMTGWIIRNGFHTASPGSVSFQTNRCHISNAHAVYLFREIFRLMSSADGTSDILSPEPLWKRMAVLLDIRLDSGGRECFNGAEILLLNGWSEYCHYPVDVSNIENNSMKCYEVIKNINNCLGGDLPACFRYIVKCLGADVGTELKSEIKSAVDYLLETRICLAGADKMDTGDCRPDKPLLDRL